MSDNDGNPTVMIVEDPILVVGSEDPVKGYHIIMSPPEDWTPNTWGRLFATLTEQAAAFYEMSVEEFVAEMEEGTEQCPSSSFSLL